MDKSNLKNARVTMHIGTPRGPVIMAKGIDPDTGREVSVTSRVESDVKKGDEVEVVANSAIFGTKYYSFRKKA